MHHVNLSGLFGKAGFPIQILRSARLLAALILLSAQGLHSQISVPAGSYIIDMGASPATMPNGVRP